MTRKMKLFGAVAAVALTIAPLSPANAYGYYHHHHDPVFGLVRAAVGVATLPVRIIGRAVTVVPAAYPVYAPRPAYYPAPVPYAYAQPVYYPQPAYAYPPQAPYGYYPGQ